MKYSRKILTFIFAIVLFIGFAGITPSYAQKKRNSGDKVRHPPVVVRHYYYWHDPFWHWNSWYDPYFYDPYLRERRQRYYLEEELRGNRRELRKHLEKYHADGVITAKEREELEDDYRDVARAERELNEFLRGE